MPPSKAHSKWLILALSSGGFAALNGLFAKLTTTELTSSLSASISHFLSLPEASDTFIEYLIRGTFFLLNLLSNITMWALFTRALTAANSTTRVSVVNTSSNFLVTAILGMVVFSERVGGLWWLGAVGMGVGCVIVGMREEGVKDGSSGGGVGVGVLGEAREGEEGEEGVVLLGGEEEDDGSVDGDEDGRKDRGRERTDGEEDLVRL